MAEKCCRSDHLAAITLPKTGTTAGCSQWVSGRSAIATRGKTGGVEDESGIPVRQGGEDVNKWSEEPADPSTRDDVVEQLLPGAALGGGLFEADEGSDVEGAVDKPLLVDLIGSDGVQGVLSG